MKKLICWVLGHKWRRKLKNEVYGTCKRCGALRETKRKKGEVPPHRNPTSPPPA